MTTAARKRHVDGDDSFDFSRARVVRRGPKRSRPLRMTLRALRNAAGKTQVQVSEATGIAQADVSRIERKDAADLDELVVSTLRRYLRAVGGELELTAVFPKTGHRIAVCGYTADED
jgi:hypothetical protein